MSSEPTLTRGESTRQAILSAAEQLFLAQGYNGTSMRQIAEGAGEIAVSGIYNHYKSKQEIFEALVMARSPYPKVIAVMESIQGGTGPEMLQRAFIELSLIMEQHFNFVRLVVIDIQEHNADTVVLLLSQLLPHAIQFFARAQRAPGLRKDIPPAILARGFVSMLMGFNMTNLVLFKDNVQRVTTMGLPDQAAWQAGVIDIFINGITAGNDPTGGRDRKQRPIMLDRLISLTRKEFIQIVRDPRTLYMTFMIPVVMLVLLGYAATNDVTNIGLVVFDQDHTPASRQLITAFQSSNYFSLAYTVDSEEQIRELVDNNSARAGIIIPPGYQQDIQRGQTGSVAFVLDGSDPTVAGTALSAAIMIGQTQSAKITAQRFAKKGMAALAETPIDVRAQVWYNPGMVSAYYMIPALIGMILQFMTTMLTSTTIVRERERGTIEQLIVTPLRSWELVVGKLVPYVLTSFIDTIEILVLGVLLFKVPINGDLALLLLLIGLFLVTTLGMGLLISTIANTQQEAMLTTLFTVMPSIFLSGFFFPIAAMPAWLQIVSYAIPLRYFLVIARGIILKGVGMQALWPEVAALALFAVIMMGAAAARFRKSLD